MPGGSSFPSGRQVAGRELSGKWTLGLAGDIMLNRVSARTSPFEGIRAVLSSASVNLANLEIPLTDVGSPTSHKAALELKARTQYILRAAPEHAPWIRAAGFDGVSLGNNHALDFGAAGLARMTQALTANGIGWTGAGPDLGRARQVIVKTLPNGVRVGMISALAFATPKALGHCTPATARTAGVNAFDAKTASAWIAEAHQRCDVLVVALHGGVERKRFPNPTQHAFARLCIDAGADVVWGHHPHVLEGAELYKGKPILYSMGNLVSNLGGQTAILQLQFDGVRFLKATLVPCLIANGKVRVVERKYWGARKADWEGLCRLGCKPPEVALATLLPR